MWRTHSGITTLMIYGVAFDKVVGFKEHFVTDLRRSLHEIVSSHHRYYAGRGLRNVCVELCEEPREHSREWTELYTAFAEKRGFTGPSRFSKPSLGAQLEVPGVTLFRVLHEGATVGMHVWYVQGDVAYAHLAAYTDAAYSMRVSYAVFWRAIEYFADQELHWLHLGQDFHFDPGTATVYTRAARIPRLSALNPAHHLRRQAPKPVRPLTDVDGAG